MNTTQHNRPTRYGTIPPRLLTESTEPHAGEGRRRRRLERKRQAGCGNKQRAYADGPEGERTGGDAMQAKPRWKKRSPGGVTTPESLPLDHHGDRPASSVTPRPTSPDENEMLGKAVPARRRASLTYPCRAPEGGSQVAAWESGEKRRRRRPRRGDSAAHVRGAAPRQAVTCAGGCPHAPAYLPACILCGAVSAAALNAHQPLSRPGFGSSWASLNEVGLGIHSCVDFFHFYI